MPQLFDFIERNALAFVRWYSQAQYLPQCSAIAVTPHATRLARLTEREQYAAMELWRGTIASHSIIVSPVDERNVRVKVRFDNHERWPLFVPVRLPGTMCIEERLPAGAAGVLVSRYHASPDLILVIDTHERTMLDAIDGHRSIAEIVDRAGGARWLPRARALFEKLFWHDQVVFDSSHAQ